MFPARRRRLLVATSAVALLALTAACSGNSDGEATEGGGDSTEAGAPSGEILVLTNRTDIVDTVFQDYVATFNETYPDVTVKFEALTDYAGEVRTRMSTTDYGDVLLIPSDMAQSDLPDFFEPLGSLDELSAKYRFADVQSLDGTVYGLATFGNANGMVYNTNVFEEAGITDLPTSPDEFYDALQAIKDNTDATPIYTNYKDGWPLTFANGLMGVVSGSPDASVEMSNADEPWAEGQERNTLDSVVYEIAARGLIEDDPTTTNWEESKNLLGTGQIGAMVLGSWAVPQMQEAATAAGGDAADIGFAPAPFQADGEFHSPIGPDFLMGINVNSDHKDAARAWLDFFIDESGFYDYAGGLPTLSDLPPSANLKSFEETGVVYLEMTAAPMLKEIDNEAEIGLNEPDYYRELIDAGRGASDKSKDDIFGDLNDRWSAARAEIG